jgi:hypothetical protein
MTPFHPNSLTTNLSMALQPVDLRSFLQFLNPIHGRQDSLDGRPAHRKFATYTQNKHTQTTVPWVGFELTISRFERAKTVNTLDLAATVIGLATDTAVK